MDLVASALDSFRCCKDEDIESFLRTKAFEFLDKKLCSIYLLLDEQMFDKGKVKIDAYFTLSHKSLISEGISNNVVGKVTGGFRKAQALHFVLIGQLGKYMEQREDGSVLAADITSEEILERAFETMVEASTLIPCRFALVECSDHPKVQKVYLDYGFRMLQYDGKHYQFIKRIG